MQEETKKILLSSFQAHNIFELEKRLRSHETAVVLLISNYPCRDKKKLYLQRRCYCRCNLEINHLHLVKAAYTRATFIAILHTTFPFDGC